MRRILIVATTIAFVLAALYVYLASQTTWHASSEIRIPTLK
ncbi:MAG TPA: hypothetical protein VFG04_15760 [Planctomycetaceae bacterium]|jgi:hypothetical protein|nr:hypothetical protein [Planctomycetaceae bacterium]